jgi:hypothetical protein
VSVYKITVLKFSMVASMYAVNFSSSLPSFNTDDFNDQLVDKITTLSGQALVGLP